VTPNKDEHQKSVVKKLDIVLENNSLLALTAGVPAEETGFE